MSPALFAMVVAATIIVATLAVAALAVLVMRGRGEAQIRRRLSPETVGSVEFEGQDRTPWLSTMARGGRVMEGWVDAEGESARLLVQAGWRSAEHRLLWYSLQATLPIMLAGVVVAFWLFVEIERKTLVLVFLSFVAAALSFLAPRWILRAAASGRRRRIKHEVPLFIHLLVLLFEAGLSARQAIASLVREGGGVLPELGRELDLALRQLDAGAEMGEVFKSMSDVLEVDDLGSVLAVLRQIDRYGGEVREPLMEVLQTIEERRSIDLREMVNLLSGRMTVVMVLFFFPALLIFVAGPAFLSIIQALGEVNAR